MELNTEYKSHLGVVGLDMNAVADGTEDAGGELDSLSDLDEVGIGELEDGMLRVRLNDDRKLDLALELVELGCVL